MNVYDELTGALKLSQKKGEDDQAHLRKLVEKVNELSDKEWEGLSRKAQAWVNSAVDAVEAQEDIPEPAGFGEPDSDDDEVEEEQEAVEAVDDDDDVPPSKGAKAVKTKEAKKAKGKPVKAAKAAKANGKAKVAAKKKEGGAKRGRAARLFKDDQRITVLSKKNPKREGSDSYDRFELYATGKKGMTVKQALDAGVTSGDLKWDNDHKFIKID
jgi:hypothetical protein